MHSRTMQVDYSIVPKNIPYCPIKDLDFTSAKGKKKKIDDLEITPPSNPSKRIRRTPIIDSLETTTRYKLLLQQT